MAIELHHLNTHGMMEQAGNVLDGVARLKARIADLEEERRWRKFPDEKPSEEGYYIICGSSGFRNADKWTYCKDRRKMDFSFYTYGVKYWMPFPSAPKEEK